MVKLMSESDGTIVPVPEEGDEELEQEEEVPPQEEVDENDLSDLTQVNREDVLGKADGNVDVDVSDLTSLDDEDDLEDLFEYDGDDDEYPGTPASKVEEEQKPKRIIRRTHRPYVPPPQELGGMRD